VLKHTVSGCQFVLILAVALLLIPIPSLADQDHRVSTARLIYSYAHTAADTARSQLARTERNLTRALQRPAIAMRYAFVTTIADLTGPVLDVAAALPIGRAPHWQ